MAARPPLMTLVSSQRPMRRATMRSAAGVAAAAVARMAGATVTRAAAAMVPRMAGAVATMITPVAAPIPVAALILVTALIHAVAARDSQRRGGQVPTPFLGPSS